MRVSSAMTLAFIIPILWPARPHVLGADKAAGDTRERARDRVVHIEPNIILEIPRVPRLCEAIRIKDRLNIGDCNLYCEQEGQGTSLVLINGGPGGTHHDFHPWFSRAADFAHVIYYDQRGCGLSDYRPGKGYSVSQAVDDLDLLRRRLGIDRWAVLGHSYGGLLAQSYAVKYPDKVKALVLVGASTGLDESSWPSRNQEFISRQEQEKIEQIRRTPGLSMAQIVYNIHLNGDWKRQNYYRPTRDQIARVALYGWVHDARFNGIMGGSASSVDLQDAFACCPIPTLIMEGTWDMSWPADKPQRFTKNHPHARLILFEASGHSPFEDEPDRFFGTLRDFLAHLPEGSSDLLNQWKDDLIARSRRPEFYVKGLGSGRRSNREIASRYDKTWLDQITGVRALRKVGFALYDVKRYDEALEVFEKMQEKAGTDLVQRAIALIWQGHMLDLLGRREEAVSRYRKAAALNVEDDWRHDQFGIAYSPSPYARQRTETPFVRHENLLQD